MKRSFNIITWMFYTWLIWGPIIINSQPGTTFFMFGIDWKADNLDNTMFWLGIIGSILAAVAQGINERDEKKLQEKRYRYDQRNI